MESGFVLFFTLMSAFCAGLFGFLYHKQIHRQFWVIGASLIGVVGFGGWYIVQINNLHQDPMFPTIFWPSVLVLCSLAIALVIRRFAMFFAFVVPVSVIIVVTIAAAIRWDVLQEFDQALVRMKAVSKFDDLTPLLEACSKPSVRFTVRRISCRQVDYDITHMGRRARASTIEASFHNYTATFTVSYDPPHVKLDGYGR